MKTFEDLSVWLEAKELFKKIYLSFKSSKDYYFKDQICRASLSVVNNIAEGYERQTQKEFRQFLYIAKGSCGEVRSMLKIAEELELIKSKEAAEITDDCLRLSKMLASFIKAISTQ